MHKLTSMEAQRVIAVMEDTLDTLNVLSYVPCTSKLDLLDAMAEAGAHSVKSWLQSQWHMEQSAMRLGAMGSDARGRHVPSAPEGGDPAGGEVPTGDSLEQIYQSTRMLCRSLRKAPQALEVLYGYTPKEPRPQSILHFNQYLSDLTAIMYRRLSTTVEEEAANKHLLHDLTECEKLAEDERDALQQTLDATRAEKEREVSGLDTTIKKLREELQEVTQTNAFEMDNIKNKAEEALTRARDDHERKVKALSERVERLSKEMVEASDANRDEEVAARKKKAKAEAELAAAVAKYDRDMAEKTEQIAQVKAKMEEESKELATLQEHFHRVDANTAQAEEEESRLAAVRERVARAMQVVDGAATKLQAAHRGRVQRAEYLKAKKKSKKGGKKGKGKK